MADRVVEVAVAGERHEVVDRQWRGRRVEVDGQVAEVGFDHRGVGTRLIDAHRRIAVELTALLGGTVGRGARLAARVASVGRGGDVLDDLGGRIIDPLVHRLVITGERTADRGDRDDRSDRPDKHDAPTGRATASADQSLSPNLPLLACCSVGLLAFAFRRSHE